MRLLEEANRRFDAEEKDLAAQLADGRASDFANYKLVVGQIGGIRRARELLVEAAKFIDSDAADHEDAAPAVSVETRDRQVKRRGYGDY